jgi:hypothetical protein
VEMGISILKRILPLILMFNVVACSNFFTTTAKKDSDEALYEDAVKLVNSYEFDAAITKLLSMSTAAQTGVAYRNTLAGAYAGKCGLDFISFLNGISTGGSSAFFASFMAGFTGTAVDPDACVDAQNVILSFGTLASERTSDQNLFLAILSMAKIGTYLRSVADTDGTGNLGNGTVDTGFDVCASTAPGAPGAGSLAPFYLSDTQVAEVITGLSLILQNIAAVTAVASGTSFDALASFEATCALIPGNPCSVTDATAVTAPMIAAFRKLLDTTAIGIGDCADSSGALCCL